MPIGIDMNNYDISMGTGQIRMSGGGTFTSDNSINYDWISRASAADYDWTNVCFGNGLFVAVSHSNGSNNSVATSPDGINWTLRTTPSSGSSWRSVAFGTPPSNPNGLFVAVADSGTSRVMTSTNGIAWTARDVSSNTNGWVGVTYGSGYFVAGAYGGNSNRIMYSSNGINWTDVTINSTFTPHGITFGNGRFVVVPVGSNNTAYYTTNNLSIGPPSTWVQSNNINALRWINVAYGNGLFVAVAEGRTNLLNTVGTGGQQLTSHVMTSPDGITWTNRYSPDIAWAGITYGAGMFVAVANRGPGNRVMTSLDGINWVLRPSANDSLLWYGIAYGNGIFVALSWGGGTGNRVMTLDPAYGMSINKITTEETTTNLVKFGQNGATISANPSKNFAWVARTAAENNAFQSVCYGNGQFVAVASDGTNRVMTSPNGYNLVARTVPLNTWVGVCYGELSGNNLYVAISNQNTNRVMYSSNGINWTDATSANETIGWRNICFGYDTSGNGRFVAVADGGTGGRVMTSSNGINWTQQNSSNNTSSWLGICYGYDSSGQGQFVSVAYDGSGNRSMYSINGGVTWTGVNTIDNNSAWNSVCYGNGTFVAVAGSGGAAGKRVMYSRHIIGAGWSQANYPVENNWRTVCFGNGLFVAVATSGTGDRVMTSPDGINWTIRASTEDNLWNSVCYGNGTFVAVSTNGTNRVMTNDYTANDNMLILNGGISSVGIGTNKPRTPLDVTGGISSNGRVDVSNVLMLRSQTTSVGYNQTSTLGFGYAGGSTNGTEFRWKVDDITYNRDSGAGPYYDYGAQSKLIFSCKSNNLYNGVANDKLYQDGLCLVPNSAGNGGLSTSINVGIGTTSPAYTLDVNGTANIRNGIIHATSIPSSSPSAIGGINFISYQVVTVGVSNGALFEKQVNITRIGSLMYIHGIVVLNTPAATTSTNITIPTGCTGTSGIRILLNINPNPYLHTTNPSIASATGIITITTNTLNSNTANYIFIDMLFGLGGSQAY